MVASCLSALHRAPPSRVVDSCFAISALRRAPPSRVVDSRFDIFSSALHVALLYHLHCKLLCYLHWLHCKLLCYLLFYSFLFKRSSRQDSAGRLFSSSVAGGLGGPQHMEQHSLERHISDTHGQERQPTRLGLVTRHYIPISVFMSLDPTDGLRLKSAILVFVPTCSLVLPTALLSRQRCEVPSAYSIPAGATRCAGAPVLSACAEECTRPT